MNIWKKRIYPGIIATILLTVVALWFKAGSIEKDIAQRTQSAFGEWANVTIDGRDVTIEGVAPEGFEFEAALKKVKATHGIRVLSANVDADVSETAKAQSVAEAENQVAKKAAEDAALQTKAAEMAAEKAAEETQKAENEEAKKLAEKAAQEAAEKVKEAELAELAAKKEAEVKEIAAKQAEAEKLVADKAAEEAKMLAEKEAAEKADSEAKMLAEKEAADKAAAKAIEIAKLAEKTTETPVETTSGALPVNPQYYVVVKKTAAGLEISGFASNEEIRMQLLDKVKAANPGVDIDETLVIEDGSNSKFQETVAFGMKQLERLDNGQITIESDSLSIFGNAKSLDNYEAFYDGLKDSSTADLNIDKVNVKAPEISPYLFGIDYDGDTVHLTGFVPNEAARKDVKAIMQSTYPGIQTTENLQIASGEPDNFLARVQQAAAKLSLVPKGIATLTDAEVKLEDATGAPLKTLVNKTSQSSEKKDGTIAKKETKEEKVVAIKKKPARKFKLAENQTCQELFEQLLSTRQVVFQPGKAVISADSLPVLKTLVRIAERCPSALLQISGHTDSDGDDGLNQTLSLARAKAVRSYLYKNGISGNRLLAVGYGEKRPIASNDTDKGKQKNRRIEFYVIEQ